MGKIDTMTKEYMGNPVVFADAFNQFLYHGDQKIISDLLTELDTTEIVVPYGFQLSESESSEMVKQYW